jgi:hypothetical protein
VSLKLIELQVAIPRTVDAAKTAIDTAQRGLVQQEQATEENRKKQLLETKIITHKDNPEKNLFHTNVQEETIHKAKQNQTKHPFKGQKIDFSG